MNGRRHLLAGVAALGAVGVPGAAMARRPGAVAEIRRLNVRFAHTGSWFRGPFRNGAVYDPTALAEFSSVLRDYRTGEMKLFDPAVLDLLWQLGGAIGVGEFTCVSGYRTPATNALVGGVPDSQHLAARALDLWLPPERLGDAFTRAAALRGGGVGIYDRWLHLDTGPVRLWDKRNGGAGESEGMLLAGPYPRTLRGARQPSQPDPGIYTAEGLRLGAPLPGGRRGVVIEAPELRNSGTPLLPPLRVYRMDRR